MDTLGILRSRWAMGIRDHESDEERGEAAREVTGHY